MGMIGIYKISLNSSKLGFSKEVLASKVKFRKSLFLSSFVFCDSNIDASLETTAKNFFNLFVLIHGSLGL